MASILDRIGELPLWEGDRHFLPLVFDSGPRAFHGVMPYRNGRMVSWSVSRVRARAPPSCDLSVGCSSGVIPGILEVRTHQSSRSPG